LPASVREQGLSEPDGGQADQEAGKGSGAGSLDLAAMEERLIGRALEQVEGNRTEAARLLGISRRTLQRKLKAFHEGKSD